MADVTILSIEAPIRLLTHALINNLSNLSNSSVNDIQTTFEMMQEYLLVAERDENKSITKNLALRIQNVCVEIEVVLDKLKLHLPRHTLGNRFFRFMYNAGHNAKHWIPFRTLHSDIQNIQKRILEIKNCQEFSELIRSQSRRSSEEVDYRLTPEIMEDYEIIGVEVTKRNIVRQLIADDEWKRSTVAIVGPLGSGKTVVANNIFRSDEIQQEFECCAWITVPPTVSTGLIPPGELVIFEMGKTNERRIPITEMGKLLKGKRYIVVVDDISDEKQWEKIEQELPNEFRTSRVLVTTIDSQIAKYVAGSLDLIHQVDKLDENHSWNLFCQKAFPSRNGVCPQDLVDMGKKIVGRCGNIPQAIVEACNLLARRRSILSEWLTVHDNLISEMKTISGNGTLWQKLLRRYKDLPRNHQKCFLYFGIFPKHCRVSCARLIRLWIAEGFIDRTEDKTSEETAQNYLEVLIARNLVQPCDINFDGCVKSCCVGDFIHEFCVKNSKERKFCSVLTDTDSRNSVEIHRRLSLHSFSLERISGQTNHVRSLIAFGYGQHETSKINVMTNEFELLTVLDLQDTPILQSPPNISKVILLRYLSLRGTKVREVPATIHELHHLEYLDLKHTFVTELPGGVCTLRNLRHLLVCSKTSTSSNTRDNIQGADVRGPIRALHSLQKLTLIKAKDRRFMNELGSLQELEKLGLVDIRREDGKYLCQAIGNMSKLSVLNLRSADDSEYLDLDYVEQLSDKLQSLYLKGALRKLPAWINRSLSSVTRIKLELSKLKGCPLLEVMQDLPHLIDLRMVESYCGQVLVFEAQGFQELKRLHIERFSELSEIYIAENAVPNLEKLTIASCKKMMTLPEGIRNLSSLKLHVLDMNREFTRALEACSEVHWMVDHIAEFKAPNGSGY